MRSARFTLKKIAIFAFFLSPFFALAAPLYTPGQTLNPSCGPTDTDCTVSSPALSGSNSDITGLSALTSLTLGSSTITDFLGAGLTITGGALTVNASGSFSTTSTNYWLTQQNSFANLASIGSTTGTTTFLGDSIFNQTVGIGTSSPFTKLGVSGTTFFESVGEGTLSIGKVANRMLEIAGQTINSVINIRNRDNAFDTNGESANIRFSNSDSVFKSLAGQVYRNANGRYTGSPAGEAFELASANDIYLYSNTSTSTLYVWASTTAFTGGNVGIGTTSPFATLSVNPIAGAASNQFVVGSSTGTSFIINNSGKVGIGTTTPSGKLDIYGTSAIDGTAPVTLRIADLSNASGWTVGAPFAALDFYSSDLSGQLSSVRARVAAVQESTTGGETGLSFSTRNLGVLTERMRMTYTGNVGIGTTSPSQALSVQGNALVSGNLITSNITATGTIAASGNGTSTFASDIMFTPDQTARFIRTGSNGGAIRFRSNSASASDRGLQFGNIDNASTWTSYMTVDNGGNVGIGTTTPSGKLDIYGTSAIDGTAPVTLRIADLSNASGWTVGAPFAALDFYSSDLSGQLSSVRARVAAVQESTTGGETGLSFSTRNLGVLTERMRMTYTGNVGIGTSSPASRLAVTQSANTPAGGLWIAETGNTDFRSVYMDTSGILSFYGGDTGGALNTATLNAAGAWTNASDRSYKENIIDLGGKYGLATVLASQPRFYEMKGTHLPQVGFIAQELKLLVPEVVDGQEGKMGISYGNLVAVAFQAIKDLNAKVEGMVKSLFVKELHIEEKLCVDDICINKDELKALLLKSQTATTTYATDFGAPIPQVTLPQAPSASSTMVLDGPLVTATTTAPTTPVVATTTPEIIASSTVPIVVEPPIATTTATTTNETQP